MKKSKIIRLCLMTALFCGVSALCACGKDKSASIKSGDGEQIVVGGNSASDIENDKIRIVGAKDLHISVRETSLDAYTSSVRAVQGEYEFDVALDSTKVNFGVQGTYSATYSYGGESVTINVTIYNAPSIANSMQTQNVVYTEFYQKIYEGIQAQDGFGNALDIQLYDTDGALNKDGSLNVGEHTLTFAAIDQAGQIVYVDKTVTIEMGATPSLSAAYTYDVEKDSFIIPLQKTDYDSLISVSFAGIAVPNRFVNKADGKVYIDGAYLFDALSFDQAYAMRVITATGHSDCTFTMLDEGKVAVDDGAILEFARKTHACFSEITVPQMLLTNYKQTATPVYTLTKDGEEVGMSDNRFTAQTEGKYILSVLLRAGQVREYELYTYYDLGFSNGSAYSSETGIVKVLKQGYTWKKCVVTCLATNEKVAVFNEGDNFDSFNEKVKALNKKFVYKLYVVASNESGEFLTQTTQFTLNGKGTQSVLTENGEFSSEKFSVANTAVTSLEYCYQEIGGRTGVYKWESNDSTASGKDSALCFGEAFRNELKPGRYITFDIYTQKAIDLYAYLPQFNKYLWYDMEKYVGNEQANYSGIRFYNQKGELLTTGGFSSGAFVNQWITVEMKLPEKDANGNVLEQAFDVGNYQCGIGIWTANKGVYTGGDTSKATYIANVKISDAQFMTDVTENEVIDTSNNALEDVIIKDLWA
ncbi:MAG: hypothetical protein IKA88_04985 [Clostridia bacterium]|nr:hypothetical protein [Clostridia bacterium]